VTVGWLPTKHHVSRPARLVSPVVEKSLAVQAFAGWRRSQPAGNQAHFSIEFAVQRLPANPPGFPNLATKGKACEAVACACPAGALAIEHGGPGKDPTKRTGAKASDHSVAGVAFQGGPL